MPGKTLGVKLDDQLRAQVLDKCQTRRCKPSDYLRDLVKKDISGAMEADRGLRTTTADIEAAIERVMQKRQEQPQHGKPIIAEDPGIPSHIPKYKCKGCGDLHDNPAFKGLPKGRCDTCGNLLNQRSDGKCPYCKYGQIESISDIEIEEMGLYA